MNIGEFATPQEEIESILLAIDDLADTAQKLAVCLRFFTCGISKKDYDTFKDDVATGLFSMCREIEKHQSTIRNNVKSISRLVKETAEK